MLELERGVSESLARRTDGCLDWPDLPENPVEELLATTVQWVLQESDLVAVTSRAAAITGSVAPVIETTADWQRHDAYAALYALAVLQVAAIDPTEAGCCAYLAHLYLTRIAAGLVHPAVGAHALWFWGAHIAMADTVAYQLLQPLAKAWEDDESSRESIESAIKDAATSILATDPS